MCQLVSEGFIQITGVGSEQDGVCTGQRYCSTPRRGAAQRERVQPAAVRNEDEPQRTRIPAAETWPLGRLVGPLRKIDGQSQLIRPCYRSDSPDSHRSGLALKRRSPVLEP